MSSMTESGLRLHAKVKRRMGWGSLHAKSGNARPYAGGHGEPARRFDGDFGPVVQPRSGSDDIGSDNDHGSRRTRRRRRTTSLSWRRQGGFIHRCPHAVTGSRFGFREQHREAGVSLGDGSPAGGVHGLFVTAGRSDAGPPVRPVACGIAKLNSARTDARGRESHQECRPGRTTSSGAERPKTFGNVQYRRKPRYSNSMA